MDKKRFEQALEQYTELEYVKLSKTEIKEARRECNSGDDETIIVDGKNTTIAPVVRRLKTQTTVCDACGGRCNSLRRKELTIIKESGKTGIRTKCLECNKYQHPETGEFILNGYDSISVWRRYLKEKIKLIGPPGRPKKNPFDHDQKPADFLENDREIITFYRHSDTQV